MNFGLAGDIWTTAGVNESQLWLHVDHLPSTDKPSTKKVVLPTYGFTVEALETCETISDVERLLGDIDRTEGMILLVVDGKVDQAAVFECSSSGWATTSFDTDWLVRTNHALIGQKSVAKSNIRPLDTWSRFQRLDELLKEKYGGSSVPRSEDLKEYLADDQVERREEDFATGYSIVACPAKRRIQFTFLIRKVLRAASFCRKYKTSPLIFVERIDENSI